VDQHDLAVVPRRGDADRRRQARTDRTEINRDVGLMLAGDDETRVFRDTESSSLIT
jgi:hypothetical protein